MPEVNLPNHLSKRLATPSGTAIEAFSDSLADAPDLQGICEIALQFALETIGRTAGILAAKVTPQGEPLCYVHENLPDPWVAQLIDQTSALHSIIRGVLETGSYIIGESAAHQPGLTGLAAAIPIPSRSSVEGVLLIQGVPCSPIDVDWLMKISRPMGRSIRLSRATSGLREEQRLQAASCDELVKGERLDAGVVLGALLENLPGNMYIIDQQYQLVTINTTMARRFGQEGRELSCQPCYQALYKRSEPCVDCMVGETLTKGKGTLRTASRLIQQHGEAYIIWEIRTYPIFDTAGQVIQAIILEEDITDRRELEAVVAQAGKLAALGQLAAGVAHEINNPLTAIIANAQILHRELPPGDERLESVDLISMAGARAAQVVRNLLDFARKEQVQRILTDINDTLRASLALVQHELVSRAIVLQFNPGEQLPAILAAPDSLQGVWLNLLLNAVESIDRAPGLIRVSSQRVGEEVQVVIGDNGRGIPPERLERIFEPFFTTKAPGRGTGLGLSVCNRVIEQHDGRIVVESQVGQGTEFKVILPIS